MERKMKELLNSAQPGAVATLCLAVILFAAFALTRATKRAKLPNVTAYILAGILIGPYVLSLVPQAVIDELDFVTDIALAFIAFDVGKYFRLSALRRSGMRVPVITIFEALAAAAVIVCTMLWVFRLPLAFSLLLGAIGCATAPASTIMTIRQYKAKGEYVDTILQVVALDDAVALIAFSVCAAAAQSLGSGGTLDASVFILPLLSNAATLALGLGCGFLLRFLVGRRRSHDNRLMLTIATVLVMSGLCSVLNVSPLLSCMMLGATYVNLTDDERLFQQVSDFTPPILTIFFVLSGMRLNVPSLAAAGLIGVVYFVVRIAGKYAGACAGAWLTHASPEIRKYLGLALIPQAGVSIGLAILAQRMLPTDMGILLSTIILSSGVLYELVGPAMAKLGLTLSHAIPVPEKKMEGAPPASSTTLSPVSPSGK